MPVYLQLTIRTWTITLYTNDGNNRRASASYSSRTRELRCQISGCLHQTWRRPGPGPLVESVPPEDLLPTRWSSLESLDHIRKREEFKIRTHWRRNKLRVQVLCRKRIGGSSIGNKSRQGGSEAHQTLFLLAHEEDCRAIFSLLGFVCVCVCCVSE